MPIFEGIVVNIGEPGIDDFAESVLEHHLAGAVIFAITAANVADLRRDVMKFVTTSLAARGVNRNNSLDVIAHAPRGIQTLVSSLLMAIVDDRGRQDDDDLVAILKMNFSQCRLLGCQTALDDNVREIARELANRLGMSVFGTLGPIDETQFSGMSFNDTLEMNDGAHTVVSMLDEFRPHPRNASHIAHIDGGEIRPAEAFHVPNVDGGETDPDVPDPKIAQPVPRGRPTASGSSDTETAERMAFAERILKAWLARFRQVIVEVGDVAGVSSGGIPLWEYPDELVGSTVAATDVIRAPVEDVVMLRSPSGASFSAEVLAAGTLLKLNSKRYGPVYVGIPPNSPQRRDWLSRTSNEQPTLQ